MLLVVCIIYTLYTSKFSISEFSSSCSMRILACSRYKRFRTWPNLNRYPRQFDTLYRRLIRLIGIFKRHAWRVAFSIENIFKERFDLFCASLKWIIYWKMWQFKDLRHTTSFEKSSYQSLNVVYCDAKTSEWSEA